MTGRGTYEEFAPLSSAARRSRSSTSSIRWRDGYAVADLVVSRAGMITVAELCAWGLPSILIPLPTAAADHQTHNARVLAEAGASLLLRQAELTPTLLGADRRMSCSTTASRREADGRARAGPRPAPRRARDSVKLLTLIG